MLESQDMEVEAFSSENVFTSRSVQVRQFLHKNAGFMIT